MMKEDLIEIDEKNDRVYYQARRRDGLGYEEAMIFTIKQFEKFKKDGFSGSGI